MERQMDKMSFRADSPLVIEYIVLDGRSDKVNS